MDFIVDDSNLRTYYFQLKPISGFHSKKITTQPDYIE
jgi:hypothetical protein